MSVVGQVIGSSINAALSIKLIKIYWDSLNCSSKLILLC